MAQSPITPPTSSPRPVSEGPTATMSPVNFSRPVGAVPPEENYRITEQGEARITEDEEVILLET